MTRPTILHVHGSGMTALPRTGPRQAATGLMPVRRPEQYADVITRADTDPTPSSIYLNRVPLNDKDRNEDQLTGWTEPVDAAEPARLAEWSA